MSKSKSNPPRKKRYSGSKIKKKTTAPMTYILEQGTLTEMRQAKKRMEAFLRHHWDSYTELVYQRSKIEDQLKQALNESCTSDYKFNNWQRAVKFKYSLHPLSTVGSTKDIGGRFNVGIDINPNIPTFPALYITCDKDTALQETLGQEPSVDPGITPRELALTSPQSETIVSVSGRLDRVIDVRSAKNLRKFTNRIKGFEFSRHIKDQAKALGEKPPEIVTTPTLLLKAILAPNWQAAPRNFDVPANAQIFGHVVYASKIEGILYPSKLTKKDCLAIFPHNFDQTASFIQIDDQTPDKKVPTKIDSSNWRLCDLEFKDLP